MHGHGLSNEICLKKAKERLYLQLVLEQKALYALYITNNMEHFSFISRYTVHAAKFFCFGSNCHLKASYHS